MGIIKVEKTKNFTIMSNHHLTNKQLSLKGKGLHSFMLSLPEDWDYSINGLEKVLKESEGTIRTTLKELEKHGYLTREQIRNDKGHIVDTDYIIYEIPQTLAISDFHPELKNPQLDNPHVDNCTQINTNINKVLKNKSPKKKYGEYGWVKLTDKQYDKLKSEHDNIDDYINRLDEYIQTNSNKNKYKDWNLVLRKSIRDNWSIYNNINQPKPNKQFKSCF